MPDGNSTAIVVAKRCSPALLRHFCRLMQYLTTSDLHLSARSHCQSGPPCYTTHPCTMDLPRITPLHLTSIRLIRLVKTSREALILANSTPTARHIFLSRSSNPISSNTLPIPCITIPPRLPSITASAMATTRKGRGRGGTYRRRNTADPCM